MSADWKTTISDVAKVLMGQSPPSSACSETGEELPFIQGNAEFGARYPRPRLRCSVATRIAESGDLLLSVRAPVGELNQAGETIVIGRGLAALRFPPGDQDFAWHAVTWAAPTLNRVAQGSTFVAVSRKDVEDLAVPWHGDANYAIARVLDAVDGVVAKSEAMIAKLKMVRLGLLHDLLSRGLDENGDLRDAVAHPEQFQDSPLGQIPKEWCCETLEEAADWFSGGTPSRSEISFWSGNIPLLTPKDMKALDLADTSEHITEEAARGGSRLMPEHTVFLVVRGMILAHTFPVCFSHSAFAFNQDIKAVRGRKGLSNRFLAHWFASNSHLFLRMATEATHGTKKLDLPDLHRVHIGRPNPEEQGEIVKRVQAFDTALAAEVNEHLKLRQIKSGLLADLLTGRVRVPDSVFPVEAHV